VQKGGRQRERCLECGKRALSKKTLTNGEEKSEVSFAHRVVARSFFLNHSLPRERLFVASSCTRRGPKWRKWRVSPRTALAAHRDPRDLLCLWSLACERSRRKSERSEENAPTRKKTHRTQRPPSCPRRPPRGRPGCRVAARAAGRRASPRLPDRCVADRGLSRGNGEGRDGGDQGRRRRPRDARPDPLRGPRCVFFFFFFPRFFSRKRMHGPGSSRVIFLPC